MIAVLDYGIGNLRSAEKALVHLGAEVCVVTEPSQATGAQGIVLPGVGSFGACVRALRASHLDKVALAAISQEVPFLGVCVGYQMLFDHSSESPEEKGLGVFGGTVRKIRGEVRLPQMQWNIVERTTVASKMFPAAIDRAWMYFVHSYVPEPDDRTQAHVVGRAEYGEMLAVAIEAGNTWGVQFHPEKSGRDGLALLDRFVVHANAIDRTLQES
jgi:glutamine amidotransferase